MIQARSLSWDALNLDCLCPKYML